MAKYQLAVFLGNQLESICVELPHDRHKIFCLEVGLHHIPNEGDLACDAQAKPVGPK